MVQHAIESPEELLELAVYTENLAKIERAAGNVGGAARLFGDVRFYLDEAARLERQS